MNYGKEVNRLINGELLKSKMALLRYTQKSLAEEIGINTMTMTSMLNGKNLPSLNVMRKISTTLHLTPQEITEIFFFEK